MASSASNGVIERRNLSVEGQVRVLKDAFEARLGKNLLSDYAALAWLPLRGRPRRQDPARATQGEAIEAVGARVR